MQALEIIPYTLAENAATTPASRPPGSSAACGRGGDMWEEHVVQPLLVNKINLSTECVGTILKIDDLIPVR